jgi:hypothetical protein
MLRRTTRLEWTQAKSSGINSQLCVLLGNSRLSWTLPYDTAHLLDADVERKRTRALKHGGALARAHAVSGLCIRQPAS